MQDLRRLTLAFIASFAFITSSSVVHVIYSVVHTQLANLRSSML